VLEVALEAAVVPEVEVWIKFGSVAVVVVEVLFQLLVVVEVVLQVAVVFLLVR
jgi:hypothetical protein